MPAYTQYGPWTDGGAPGIASAFLNPLESFLASINSAAYDANISSNGSGTPTFVGVANSPNSSSLNGATSGTATLYQWQSGTIKILWVYCNNFKNGGGSNQTLAIPTPFTTLVNIKTMDTPTIALLSSSSAQNIGVVTALPTSGTSGGTYSTYTTIAGFSGGFCLHAIDTISFQSGAATAHTGLIELYGI